MVQDGLLGCRVAHERAVCEGCAGDVIGAMAERLCGSVFEARGKRIGETKGGQLSRDISARLSAIVFVLGQESDGG